MAATFRVTSSDIIRTSAERRLPSTDSVLKMLKWVERHLDSRDIPNGSVDYPTFRRNSRSKQNLVQMEMIMSDK